MIHLGIWQVAASFSDVSALKDRLAEQRSMGMSGVGIGGGVSEVRAKA